MMGIPGINATPSPADQKNNQTESPGGTQGRQTMFGFPVPDDMARGPGLQEPTDDGEYDATQLVGSSLIDAIDRAAFDFMEEAGPSDGVRTTSMGGMPSVQRPGQDVVEEPTWGLRHDDEDDDDEGADRTLISSSSLFTRDRTPPSTPALGEPVHDRPKRHETLMGMSLGDILGGAQSAQSNVFNDRPDSQTLFSLPAPNTDYDSDGLSEPSEEEDDAPTQALSGSRFDPQDAGDDLSRESSRRRLLEKLRSTRAAEEEGEGGVRSTMFGIPGVRNGQGDTSQDQSLKAEHAASAPHTGVLKIGRRRTGKHESLAEDSNVLGASAYTVVGSELGTDSVDEVSEGSGLGALTPSEAEQQGHITHVPGVSYNDRTRVASGEVASIAQRGFQQLGDEISDPADRTHVVDNRTSAQLKSLSMRDVDWSTAPQKTPSVNDDATREQNIDALRDHLRRQSGTDTLSEKDDTRRQDVSRLRQEHAAGARTHLDDSVTNKIDTGIEELDLDSLLSDLDPVESHTREDEDNLPEIDPVPLFEPDEFDEPVHAPSRVPANSPTSTPSAGSLLSQETSFPTSLSSAPPAQPPRQPTQSRSPQPSPQAPQARPMQSTARGPTFETSGLQPAETPYQSVQTVTGAPVGGGIQRASLGLAALAFGASAALAITSSVTVSALMLYGGAALGALALILTLLSIPLKTRSLASVLLALVGLGLFVAGFSTMGATAAIALCVGALLSLVAAALPLLARVI